MHGRGQRLELGRAAEETERRALDAHRCGGCDRTREERAGILLAEDRRLHAAGLRRRLEAELLVEHRAEAAITAQGVVLSAERVEGEHLRAVRPLAEAIERGGGFCMCECGSVVELGKRRVCGLEVGAENTALVGAAQVDGPRAVGLVLQDLADDELERLLERGPCDPGRLAAGALEQLVEAVQVEHHELAREPVRLGLGDDELPGTVAVSGEVAPEHRHEGLERSCDVLRALVAPEELRDPIGGHPVPARGEEDLEHLLRADAAEVAGAQAALAVLDRQRPEQPDQRPGLAHRTSVPFGRTTSQRPPNSRTF